MDNREFLSIGQVAARLGISRAHCYRLAARSLLPTLELGRRKVVPAEWLRRWLDDRYEELPSSQAAIDDQVDEADSRRDRTRIGHRRVAPYPSSRNDGGGR